ncbi:fungal specific transcription factor [Pseudohyphozyma bogoriensis]|nr:fungal specific transcription factor [Pseudohyphozyma bogoriensis]
MLILCRTDVPAGCNDLSSAQAEITRLRKLVETLMHRLDNSLRAREATFRPVQPTLHPRSPSTSHVHHASLSERAGVPAVPFQPLHSQDQLQQPTYSYPSFTPHLSSLPVSHSQTTHLVAPSPTILLAPFQQYLPTHAQVQQQHTPQLYPLQTSSNTGHLLSPASPATTRPRPSSRAHQHSTTIADAETLLSFANSPTTTKSPSSTLDSSGSGSASASSQRRFTYGLGGGGGEGDASPASAGGKSHAERYDEAVKAVRGDWEKGGDWEDDERDIGGGAAGARLGFRETLIKAETEGRPKLLQLSLLSDTLTYREASYARTGMDQASQAEMEGKPKAGKKPARNTRRSSCQQCRSRKSKAMRGEPCQWMGVGNPPPRASTISDELQAARQEVKRLTELVHLLLQHGAGRDAVESELARATAMASAEAQDGAGGMQTTPQMRHLMELLAVHPDMTTIDEQHEHPTPHDDRAASQPGSPPSSSYFAARPPPPPSAHPSPSHTPLPPTPSFSSAGYLSFPTYPSPVHSPNPPSDEAHSSSLQPPIELADHAGHDDPRASRWSYTPSTSHSSLLPTEPHTHPRHAQLYQPFHYAPPPPPARTIATFDHHSRALSPQLSQAGPSTGTSRSIEWDYHHTSSRMRIKKEWNE